MGEEGERLLVQPAAVWRQKKRAVLLRFTSRFGSELGSSLARVVCRHFHTESRELKIVSTSCRVVCDTVARCCRYFYRGGMRLLGPHLPAHSSPHRSRLTTGSECMRFQIGLLCSIVAGHSFFGSTQGSQNKF